MQNINKYILGNHHTVTPSEMFKEITPEILKMIKEFKPTADPFEMIKSTKPNPNNPTTLCEALSFAVLISYHTIGETDANDTTVIPSILNEPDVKNYIKLINNLQTPNAILPIVNNNDDEDDIVIQITNEDSAFLNHTTIGNCITNYINTAPINAPIKELNHNDIATRLGFSKHLYEAVSDDVNFYKNMINANINNALDFQISKKPQCQSVMSIKYSNHAVGYALTNSSELAKNVIKLYKTNHSIKIDDNHTALYHEEQLYPIPIQSIYEYYIPHRGIIMYETNNTYNLNPPDTLDSVNKDKYKEQNNNIFQMTLPLGNRDVSELLEIFTSDSVTQLINTTHTPISSSPQLYNQLAPLFCPTLTIRTMLIASYYLSNTLTIDIKNKHIKDIDSIIINMDKELIKVAGQVGRSNTELTRKLHGAKTQFDENRNDPLKRVTIDVTNASAMEAATIIRKLNYDQQLKQITNSHQEKLNKYSTDIDKIYTTYINQVIKNCITKNSPLIQCLYIIMIIIAHGNIFYNTVKTEVEIQSRNELMNTIMKLKTKEEEAVKAALNKDAAAAMNIADRDPNTLKEIAAVTIQEYLKENSKQIVKQIFGKHFNVSTNNNNTTTNNKNITNKQHPNVIGKQTKGKTKVIPITNKTAKSNNSSTTSKMKEKKSSIKNVKHSMKDKKNLKQQSKSTPTVNVGLKSKQTNNTSSSATQSQSVKKEKNVTSGNKLKPTTKNNQSKEKQTHTRVSKPVSTMKRVVSQKTSTEQSKPKQRWT